MQNPWLQIKQEIAKKLKININEIEEPENFGDLAYPCFSLAKKFKESPQQIAAKLAAALKGERGVPTKEKKKGKKSNISARTKKKKKKAKGAQKLKKYSKIKYIKEIKALGPYINFYIDWKQFTPLILKSVNKNFGKGKSKGKIMIDTYSANPFKTFHIGHIRNAVLGESIRRLLEFQGNKTKTGAYSGDVGTHIAKWIWFYMKFYKGKVPKNNFTRWAGDIYAKAIEKVRENSKHEEEVNEVNRLLDKRDKKVIGLWKKIRKLSYDDIKKIAKELDCKIDYYFPESECEKPGKKWVSSLYKKKKLIKSEGAIGINLEKYNLGFFILIKSDGTALYSTKDFGLLYLKNKKFKFIDSIYVIGSEQDFYLKQLFKTYEILKLPGYGKHYHISHGLVTLKEGKMSSRLGNVISYEDLREEMKKKVLERIDPKLKNRKKIAKQIAFAAIKFSMLDMDNNKLIKFDWEQALDFEGKSGPYLQYTCVRANSILERFDNIRKLLKQKKHKEPSFHILKDSLEITLIKKIAIFPEITKKSSVQYSPNILANYLFELAQDFNSFYQKLPVLKAEDNLRLARLKLVESVKTILETGLYLLGIEVPEKM